jgi:hypothetical protein
MSKPRVIEIRPFRNLPSGELKRILVAAAECGVRPSEFCRSAVSDWCRKHEAEQNAAKRLTTKEP